MSLLEFQKQFEDRYRGKTNRINFPKGAGVDSEGVNFEVSSVVP